MPVQTRAAVTEAALARRARVLEYIRMDPPLPLTEIMEREGMTNRAVRTIVKELEIEHGIDYMPLNLRKAKDALPFGLTSATLRLRQKLGDHLYMLRERGNDSAAHGRYSVSPLIGINNREQIRAEQRPFNHDWKLSQIERLARELNRDPRELMMSCLTG